MDRNGDDLFVPHEDDMDVRLQTSNDLDLNLEQDSLSPEVADIDTMQSNISSKNEANVDEFLSIGTEFDSDEHAYSFYNKYAELVGFSVRKDWVNRSKVHGQVVSRKFTCSKEGYRRRDKRDANVKKHRKETRTGCLAHLIITRQPDGKYRVTHFEARHNHEKVNPSNIAHALLLQNQSNIDPDVEANSESNSGMQSKLTFELMCGQFRDLQNIDCLPTDYDTSLPSGRTRDIKQGEAGRLLHYFQQQQFQNPSFFYATQLDVNDKMTNIFWAHDNMILDYTHFGDFVCFDTSFRASEDFRPFVQFVGLNHHREAVIFGAALLYDETVESYMWLFRTFIEAMSGEKPKAVLTDQDAAIVKAIFSVLPKSNHLICVWQLYQNTLKHLSHMEKDVDSFAVEFRSCIYDYEDEEDFVHAWEAMLDKFCLRQNEWLRWMFREREKWGVAYGRNTFFIDMKGTDIIEKFSNKLIPYVNSDLDVLEFCKQFEKVVYEQHYKEFEAACDMTRCVPRLIANVVLLKHASDVYTPKAFDVFKREYERCLNVVVNQCIENGSLFQYKTNTYGKSRVHVVTYDLLDDKVTCDCMKFEYVGILCSHALKVLDHRNIKVVPSQYILKRWTKDAKTVSTRGTGESKLQENKLIAANRYKELCKNVRKIAAGACQSEQAFQFAATRVNEVITAVEKILNIKSSEEAQTITSSSTGANAYESEHDEIFLDRNAIELREKKCFDMERGRVRICSGKSSKTRRVQIQNVQPSTLNASISCSPPAYVPSDTTPQTSVTQDLFNFEANQAVQCPFQPLNLVEDQHSHPSIYQSSDIFSNQHNSPSQSQLLQESVVCGTFQESVSSSSQSRQALDLDAQRPRSPLFYGHSYRVSDT